MSSTRLNTTVKFSKQRPNRLCKIQFFKNRLPTSACLIEQVADGLINFQAVVNNKA